MILMMRRSLVLRRRPLYHKQLQHLLRLDAVGSRMQKIRCSTGEQPDWRSSP